MSRWELRLVPFKYQLGDLTLFSLPLPLQVRVDRLVEETAPAFALAPPVDELITGSEGFVVRGLPLQREMRMLTSTGGFFCYVPSQYQHCYIDLRQSFDEYQRKFSSKTRWTINRKVRKYAEHCGGAIPWKSYKSAGDMRDFFRQARVVSKASYQERLLDDGLPDTEEFMGEAEALASEDRVRAFLLFDGELPVAYLYCPVTDGVLSYSHLGYDPQYMEKSVGIVLQWLAVQELFEEGIFRYFDFTEGQSDHKRLFSTHQRHCGNVFMVRRSLRNAAIIYGHLATDRLSHWLGETLERLGVKAKVKRVLRFGRS
jgi:CelD/BcsL family acetyltransferase involved in cellulose biosynthesis